MKAILTYHSIDDSGSPISVSPRVFASHHRWLTSGRVLTLSLDDLVAHPDEGPDAVSVTFDDGFLNTREWMQSLRTSGVPVTTFVVTRHVGGTNAWGGRSQAGIPTDRLLDWSDLEKLAAAGVELAPHTRSHRSLTDLSPAAADEEMRGSAEDLEGRLGVASRHFAYPYGHVHAAVKAAAGRHFRFAHSTRFDVLSAADDPLVLPRIDMYYLREPGVLERWGSPGFARRLRWVQARRWVSQLVR